jgi:type I restriction enzyme S subunit
MHPQTQSLFKRESSGSAVPQLTGKQIGELVISLPTERAQDFFSGKLVAVREAAFASMQHLEKLDALFASLQRRAFSGELILKEAERELAMVG